MNSDIFKGKWNQLRGEVQKRWGQLTDDDLDVVQGDMTKLAGVLQEKYGYSREQAQQEVDRFVRENDTDTGMTGSHHSDFNR